VISTVAGNGTPGFSGDNGPATSAQLSTPGGVAVNGAGNVYIGDSGNNRIRVLTPAGATGPTPTIMSVVNAASYNGGPISAGEVVTIFGSGIGPATPHTQPRNPSTGQAGDHDRRRAGAVQWHRRSHDLRQQLTGVGGGAV